MQNISYATEYDQKRHTRTKVMVKSEIYILDQIFEVQIVRLSPHYLL
jgi:hypothetical protein